MIANQKAFSSAAGGSCLSSKAPSPAPKKVDPLPPADFEPSTAAAAEVMTGAESTTSFSVDPLPGTPVVGETSNYNSAFLVGTPMEI